MDDAFKQSLRDSYAEKLKTANDEERQLIGIIQDMLEFEISSL